MKYGIKGGKQTNSDAPTIKEHSKAKGAMKKGDSRSKSSGSSGVQGKSSRMAKY